MDKRAAKQQRIESILLSLKRLDYLTRRQIQTIHGLKGERNANRILNDMGEYLTSFRHGLENVYYLNKNGRERINWDVIRKKTPNIQHYLLRNQLWVAMKCPHTWENEIKIHVGDDSIVCDAKFLVSGNVPVFVEVDVTQPMIKNTAKMERYKRFKQMTKEPFHLLWVTEIEGRRAKLNGMMGGMTGKVYTWNEIK